MAMYPKVPTRPNIGTPDAAFTPIQTPGQANPDWRDDRHQTTRPDDHGGRSFREAFNIPSNSDLDLSLRSLERRHNAMGERLDKAIRAIEDHAAKLAFIASDSSQRALRRGPDVDLTIRQKAIEWEYALATAAAAASRDGDTNIDIDWMIINADHVVHWLTTGEHPDEAAEKRVALKAQEEEGTPEPLPSSPKPGSLMEAIGQDVIRQDHIRMFTNAIGFDDYTKVTAEK